jgi:hypothetical protein
MLVVASCEVRCDDALRLMALGWLALGSGRGGDRRGESRA